MTATGLHSFTRMTRRLWLPLVGPVMWGLHMLAGYVGGALVCKNIAGDGPRAGADVLILALTVVAALVTSAALVTALRRSRGLGDDSVPASETTELDRFIDVVAVGTNGFTLLAIVLEGLWAGWMSC